MPDVELLDAETSTEMMVANKYGITKAVIQDAIDAANDLAATNPTDKAGIEKVRRYRLDVLRPMRITVDKKHDAIKKEALEYCRVTDRVARELKAMIEPAEQRLQEIEDAPKREAERLAKIAEEARAKELERRQQLAFAVRWSIQPAILISMTQEKFETAYTAEKERFDAEEKAKAEAEAKLKAEQERQDAIAKEQAERQAEIDRKESELAEQQRKIDEENRRARDLRRTNMIAKLAAVGSRRDPSALDAMSDEDFADYLAVETEKFAAAQKAKAEAERIRKEQEAKELEAHIERQAAERAAKIEAERLAEEERKRVAKEKAEDAAKRKAARAPDREKISDYTNAIAGLGMPDIADLQASTRVDAALNVFIAELEEIAASLE